MDETNLKTASLYINNQLLSRGLLRNGQNIDFARPDRGESGRREPGVLEGTMGRVMGVVNDLILRRDRDATQRENLTTTIRTLKSDSLRQTTELERLQAKFAESQRKLGIAEATERALKLQIKSAESKERGLREEMARMKELVKQTRNQCAVEVRKRERVIEGLKKHVGDGRVRGGGKNPGTREIVVIGGVGEREAKEGGAGVGEEGYDLRSETNEFLTELARGLSEENESLAALSRRTLENLKTLSGWEKVAAAGPGGMVMEMEMGYEALAADMEAVIDHVRTLLTNPSFVPLEEVEVREEEIIRLREGWERMESRWKEAVQMMDGWRKRMARNGQTVNLEELRMGLLLSPLKTKEDEKEHPFQLSVLEEEGEGDTQVDIDAMDDIVEPGFDEEMDESDSSMFEADPMEEEAPEEAPEEAQEHEASFVSESSVMSPPQLSPLKESSGNRYLPPPAKENEGFSTIVEENTFDLLQLATSPEKPKSIRSTPQSTSRSRDKQNLSTPPEDEIDLLSTSLPQPAPQPSALQSQSSSPQKSTRSNPTPTPKQPKLRLGPESRLPRPRDTSAPQQSPLTMASIAAKLAASEREADAARVRAKLKAVRAGRVASAPKVMTGIADSQAMPPPPLPVQTIRMVESEENVADMEVEREREGEVRSRKRKAPVMDGGRERAKAKVNRRRSTLSPWELESLILGGVGVGSPEKGN